MWLERRSASTGPPRVWLQASTATIYAHRYDSANDERSGFLGGDKSSAPSSRRFSIEVAKAWETAFDEAITNGTRKIALRSAMTLSSDPGGVFDTLVGLVRFGLRGSAEDGQQFMSLVHYEDFVSAVGWLIDQEDIDGTVNVASPNPLPNPEFMRVLPSASNLWVQSSLNQKQRLQQLFFPEGVRFDGKRLLEPG